MFLVIIYFCYFIIIVYRILFYLCWYLFLIIIILLRPFEPTEAYQGKPQQQTPDPTAHAQQLLACFPSHEDHQPSSSRGSLPSSRSCMPHALAQRHLHSHFLASTLLPLPYRRFSILFGFTLEVEAL